MKALMILAALGFGIYANHNAEQKVAEFQRQEKQTAKLQKKLTPQDYDFMKRISESHVPSNIKGLTKSLIVKNGTVLAEGDNQATPYADPSAHATVIAVKEACKKIGSVSLKDYTLYSNAEPCPMCLSLLYITGIDKIVYNGQPEVFPPEETLLGTEIYEALSKARTARPIPQILFPSLNSR
jgi:tRNA(Arg) A34 adenosine deaminase TadA